MLTELYDFVTGAQARGWRPSEFNPEFECRDAAHEAFHALTSGSHDFSRKSVDKSVLLTFGKGLELWHHEIEARLIEREVCRVLNGIYEGRIEDWLTTSILEASKRGLPFLNMSETLKVIEDIDPSRTSVLARHVIGFDFIF